MAPRPRSELQTLLKSFVDNVYFQPPASMQMKFPCIVYKRDDIDFDHADNRPYNKRHRYQITVIDQDPDSVIPAQVATLPTVSFDRNFAADNLNHDVFTLFF